MRRFGLLMVLLCLAGPVLGAADSTARDHYFTTSDNVRLHYLQSGPPTAPTIVFIPGWTMPGWIFEPQRRALSPHYDVIEFDPRGQGASAVPATGYNQTRRAADIADLLTHLGPSPVVLAGWSLGVLDTLAYVHIHGDARIAGLVLIDNSVGENPAPGPRPPYRGPIVSHAIYMREFVAGMFRTRQSPAYLARLTAATLRLPAPDAAALLSYPVPRSYWRDAIFSTGRPVLYIVRPGFAGQADNLLRDRPNTAIAVYTGAGHALFVDDARRFNAQLLSFLASTFAP